MSFLAVVFLVCFWSSISARAQQATQPVSGATGSFNFSVHGVQADGVSAYMSVLTRRMAAMRMSEMNVDRQKHLQLETNRLVDLATDLDKDMHDGKEVIPLDLSRRAAEIERLAHSVQERMKG